MAAGFHFLGIKRLRGAESGVRGQGSLEVTSCSEVCSYKGMMFVLVTRADPTFYK